MLSSKENALKLFRHEMPDYIPKYGDGIINNVPINGYHERPEGGKGGYDWFGVHWSYSEGDPAPMPGPDFILEDICDWKEVVTFPDLDAFDWETAAEKDRILTFDREKHLLSQMIHNGVYERLNALMGMEEAMVSLVLEPEECKAFFEAVADYKIKLIDKLHQYYKPDIICYHDDWGSQKNLMMSPDTWRELIKPATKRIFEHGKSLGIIMELHSDGMIKEIVPEIVDDIGADAIQIMEINDIPQLKKLTGNKVVYDTFVNVQKIAADEGSGALTKESLKNWLMEDFKEHAAGGCYLPSFVFMPPKWVDTIYEAFDAVQMEVYK
ncbi:MAG: hypothetical protein K6G01_08060 [Eubacterium sp.]|nr:hypothetical protein [Eubacterium sp.]